MCLQQFDDTREVPHHILNLFTEIRGTSRHGNQTQTRRAWARKGVDNNMRPGLTSRRWETSSARTAIRRSVSNFITELLIKQQRTIATRLATTYKNPIPQMTTKHTQNPAVTSHPKSSLQTKTTISALATVVLHVQLLVIRTSEYCVGLLSASRPLTSRQVACSPHVLAG